MQNSCREVGLMANKEMDIARSNEMLTILSASEAHVCMYACMRSFHEYFRRNQKNSPAVW